MDNVRKVVLTVKNKKTGEVLNNDCDGIFATVFIQANGEIELEAIGTCKDCSMGSIQDTDEEEFDPNDFYIVDMQYL